MTRKPPINELEALTKHRQERALYELGRKPWVTSVGENLLVVLDSPLKATLTNLLAELAALAVMANPMKAAQMREGGRDAEKPIPSFYSAWAERRLEQIDQLLWAETERLAAFTKRPADPSKRPYACLTCGNPPHRDDICCRKCGRQLQQADQL
jgi:hypothetical protein